MQRRRSSSTRLTCCVPGRLQSTPWVLENPSTYRTSTTHWLTNAAVTQRFGVNFRRGQPSWRKGRKRRASVSDGLVVEGALFSNKRWVVPEPGQVWIRLRRLGDMRQRRDAALSQKLADPCGYVVCVCVCVCVCVWLR